MYRKTSLIRRFRGKFKAVFFNTFPFWIASRVVYRILGLLESAHKLGGSRLKRFVVLGSAVAILKSYMGTEGTGTRDYDEDDWNPVNSLAPSSFLIRRLIQPSGYSRRCDKKSRCGPRIQRIQEASREGCVEICGREQDLIRPDSYQPRRHHWPDDSPCTGPQVRE